MSKKIQKAFEEWWIDEDLGSDLYDLHKGDARYVWTQCAESRDTEVKELEEDFTLQQQGFTDVYHELKNQNKVLRDALEKVEMQINRHRTWTGMGWKQNPLADFVAVKISTIIQEALSKTGGNDEI